MILLSPYTILDPKAELHVAPAALQRAPELPCERPLVTARSLLLIVILGLLAGAAHAVWERRVAPAVITPRAPSQRPLAI